MHNPWQHGEVPDDGAVRKSKRGVRIAGVLMWLVIVSIAGLFILTDIGGERATTAMVQVLQLTTVTVAICVIGWIIQRVLRRLELFDGTLVNAFSMLFVFGLPVFVGIAAYQMGFFSGILSNELSKIVPIERWTEQLGERTIGPIKDVMPWN